MTRVLHVAAGNLYGGVETVLRTLALNATAAPGMEQHFALSFEGTSSEELRGTGLPVHDVGEVRLRSPLQVRRARRRLRELVAREGFDTVVCHSAWAMVVFGPEVLRSGVPLVFWLHDRADPAHWLYRLARRCRPTLIICNSRFTADSVAPLYRNVSTEVLSYPVEDRTGEVGREAREQVRAELGTDDAAVVIIQVSRMEEWKGHRLHLAGLARLKDLPGWSLWIVGGAQRPQEEAYRKELEEQALELGIADRIKFLGQRTDVPRMLGAADIHCQPNTGPEPFGIVFIEAMYAGLPSVATAMGGPLEILDDGFGILVPPGDPEKLAGALRRLVENPIERRAIGARGPARAAELCSPTVQVGRLYAVLSDLGSPVPGR